ncbi:DUF2147 domain-containing protein [Amaricoccus macauensis]|uniref:DUF2147 domain-containing protein n=1 Tax=Amaricoccus macauensis TaxID=57001 RepID=UPI003C7A6D9A
MMRNLAVLAVSLVLAAPAHAADPVIGSWKTQPDDNGHFGFVDVEPCGAEICGTLVHAFDNSGNEIASGAVGRKIIWDMQPAGGGKYGNGQIWSPDRDKTYASKMALSGDTLKVSGCVLGLCRSQTWTRGK